MCGDHEDGESENYKRRDPMKRNGQGKKVGLHDKCIYNCHAETREISFCRVVILLRCESEGSSPALLTLCLALAQLLKQRAQSRQLSATETPSVVAMRVSNPEAGPFVRLLRCC
jgi:hypothetical protein